MNTADRLRISALTLYCWCLFFLPYTQLGVPLGIFKFILSDFFLLAACAVLLICRLKEGDWRLPERFTPVLITFLLLFGVLLGSGFVAVDQFRFFASLLPWLYIAMFLLLSGLLYQRHQERFIKQVFWYSMVSLSISTVPLYLNFLAGISFPGMFDWIRYTFMTGNPNQYAAYLLTTTFAALVVIERFFPRRRWWAYALLALVTLPAFGTGSQTAFVVMIALIVNYFFYRFLFLRWWKKALILVPSVMLVGYLALNYRQILLSLEHIGGVRRAAKIVSLIVEGDPGESESNIDVRVSQLEDAAEIFPEHPILGVGLANFKAYHKRHELHNTFGAVLIEAGLIGFLALMLFFGAFFWQIVSIGVSWQLRLFVLGNYLLFMVMNLTHLYLRERWSWVFILLTLFALIYKKR